MDRKKIILDTDPGVDDATAIILALRSPELEVLAITTVSGNVHVNQCTTNVRRILALLRPEPCPFVAAGEDRPLVKPPFSAPSVHGEDGLGDLGNAYYPDIEQIKLEEKKAVDLILDLIVRYPDEVTLIPVGPLTNIARAILKDPRTMRRVKEIILMGGAVTVPGNIPPGAAEFNLYVDPHAAEVVLNFGLPVTMVPLDVTHQVKLTRELARRELSSAQDKAARFIWDACQKYMDFYRDDQGYDGCYLHDPLAVGVAIDPSFIMTEEMRIYVETEGKVTAGMTLPFRHPTKDPAKIDRPNVQVATRVEAERFLNFFLLRVKGDR